MGEYFEVSKREVIISVVITLIMISIGLFIATKISDNVQLHNELYTRAIKIDNNIDEFDYGMRTNIGNSLVYGEFNAIDTVKNEKITGEYMAIKVEKERYTRHTRRVSYKVGKVTHYRTEVYYTWDNINTDYNKSSKLTILNKEFSTAFFNIGGYNSISLKDSINPNFGGKVNMNYLYEDNDFFASVGDIRYSFSVIPKTFFGSFICKLELNGIWSINKQLIEVNRGFDIPALIDKEVKSDTGALWIFWILWLLLTGAMCFRFVYFENKWLEN